MSLECGNPKHPNGAWHTATPYDPSIIGGVKRWWRVRQHGCSCKATEPNHNREGGAMRRTETGGDEGE